MPDYGSSAASISTEGKPKPTGLFQPSPDPVQDRQGL